jgi:membrane protease YdiL (CAAX protease family)
MVPLGLVTFNIQSGLQVQNFASLYMWVLVSLLIGLCEEMVFRGVILRTLYSKGIWKAILISSFIFAILHFGPPTDWWSFLSNLIIFLFQFVGGMNYAILRIKFKSILPLIFIHFMIDVTAFLSTHKPIFDIYPGWTEAVLVLVIECIYFIFLVWKFKLLKKQEVLASD